MKNFNNFLVFLLGFSLSGLIYGIGLLFLQKVPIFYISEHKEYSFYPINLTSVFFNTFKKPKIVKKDVQTLKGIELKGLYYNGKDGFVILKDKKTIFVDLGKSYKGYKLIKIGINYAIFEKNSKEYKIVMKKEKLNTNFKIKTEPIDFKRKISRKIFESYKNNLTKIWQNIGIIKVKDGYMITYVKPKSIFEQIGLRRGDILLEVNGRKLKNDADAWDLYKNADKFDVFEIKIKRNNQIKVLSYEMD